MATQNTQVCCCGASTWTSVFAWLQIVVAVFGIVGASVSLAAVDEVKGGKHKVFTPYSGEPTESYWYDDVDEDDRQLTKAMLIVVLVLMIVNFVLGILLLIGNKQEKLGLIWTWLIVTGISAVMSVISGIVSATAGGVSSLVSTIISAAISAFMIYVVHRRIQDIKLSSGQGQMSSGASFFKA